MDIIPFLTLGLTVVIGIISFFIKRELDLNDKEICRLDERVKLLEERVMKQELAIEKLNGKVELVIEILERVERKLEERE